MDADNIRCNALSRTESYLAGDISWRELHDWALRVVLSPEWEALPAGLRDAVHVLFDLHDQGEPWCPEAKELRDVVEALKRMRGVPGESY